MSADRKSLYVAVFSRSLATGLIGVLLGVHLAALELPAATVGLVIGLGLAGAALATTLVTFFADRIGHRRCLLWITALTVVGAVALTFTTSPWALGVAAFVGMVNGMGRDRGAALVIEQAALPATGTDAERTMSFAKYNVLQDMGHAAGSLLAGIPALLHAFAGVAPDTAQLDAVWLYALLCAVPLVAYARLSASIETPRVTKSARLTPDSRRTLTKISALFAIDAVGGGFLTTALLSYFFYERFGVGASEIGLLFFVARVANAASHFAAAALAKRIGLV